MLNCTVALICAIVSLRRYEASSVAIHFHAIKHKGSN